MECAALDAGQIEQVVDHPGQTVGLLIDGKQKFRPRIGIPGN